MCEPSTSFCDAGNWEIESIPNEAVLYYRVSKKWLRPEEKMHPGVFQEAQGSMSTDWEKYSSPMETKQRVAAPDKFYVIKLLVSYIRYRHTLSVIHSPSAINLNQAHTDVFGIETNSGIPVPPEDKVANRTYLFKMFKTWKWED